MAPDPSKHFALLVGLSKYPAVGDLKGTLNDLQDVTDWLTGELHLPANNVVSWTDAPPKYRSPSTNDFLGWLVDWDAAAKTMPNSKIGDRLYVYFAGHGYNATTAQQSMVMPLTTPTTWSVVPMVPLRESLRLRAHFDEIVIIFDACRDILSYAIDLGWADKPAASLRSGQVKVFSSFASKTGKKAKEVEFNGRWAGVLTRAFLTGAKGYAADENGVVYSSALRAFIFAAVKDRLGLDFEPEVDDGIDPNDRWALFNVPRRLPRIVVKPVTHVSGLAKFRKRGEQPGDIDLAAGIQVLEVPYGYYALTLPDGTEQTVIAVWEEKIVEV
jgi:hypothetical protein